METLSILTILFLVFISALILFHHIVHDSRLGRLVDRIPGPKWYPIIGNYLDFLVPPVDIWHLLRRLAQDYYPVYKIWIVNKPIVNIFHPDDIQILLSSRKHITKSMNYDHLHPWLNDGLLTSTGEKWKTRRKIITPAFHLNSLRDYSNNIFEQTKRLVTNLREEAKDGCVNKELLPMVSRFTTNLICETAMGIMTDEKDPEQDNYIRSVHEVGKLYYYRCIRPWLRNNFIFSLTSKGRLQLKVLKILHRFTSKIIKDRKQYHGEMNGGYLDKSSISISESQDKQSVEIMRKKRLIFLDLLIASSKLGLGLDDQGIREEVNTFVFAGHDTAAMAIFFTIHLLAEHTDIQTRARDEIDAILTENDGKMTFDGVQRFSYLECCIKETLRLYPSVPTIGRQITEDIQLRHCFLPKGTISDIHIVDVHRDPNFWSQPDIYDPDRFLPERINGRHPFSYIPFSGGPRNCIGQKFAMLELKAAIGGLLHHFHFESLGSTANIRIVRDIVIRAAHPVFKLVECMDLFLVDVRLQLSCTEVQFRFLPERINERHPFSYIPFSGGPRNCIGQKFAMLELKAVIGELLHHFHFESLGPTANIRIVPDMVIRTAHPVYVKFVPIIK